MPARPTAKQRTKTATVQKTRRDSWHVKDPATGRWVEPNSTRQLDHAAVDAMHVSGGVAQPAQPLVGQMHARVSHTQGGGSALRGARSAMRDTPSSTPLSEALAPARLRLAGTSKTFEIDTTAAEFGVCKNCGRKKPEHQCSGHTYFCLTPASTMVQNPVHGRSHTHD